MTKSKGLKTPKGKLRRSTRLSKQNLALTEWPNLKTLIRLIAIAGITFVTTVPFILDWEPRVPEEVQHLISKINQDQVEEIPDLIDDPKTRRLSIITTC